MRLSYLLSLTLALAPSLASAAIFPADTKVKMLDPKGFRQAMKQNETSLVAFVAPWCGHCQKLAPEYHKLANMLMPMVPVYAVDCDAEMNKRMCAEQGVQGFPTVKLFPRGRLAKPMVYEGRRNTKDMHTWVFEHIPHGVKTFEKPRDVAEWAKKNIARPRAVLFTANQVVPLIWRALANKYKDHIKFANIRDRDAAAALEMGLIDTRSTSSKKVSRIIIYPEGSSSYTLYGGVQNYKTLVPFMKELADGTAKLNITQEKPHADETAETSTSVPAATPAQEPLASETPLNVVEPEPVEPEPITSEEGAGVDGVEEPIHVEAEPASAETPAAKSDEATEGPGSTEHVKDEL